MIDKDTFELLRLQAKTLVEVARHLKRIADFFEFVSDTWEEEGEEDNGD